MAGILKIIEGAAEIAAGIAIDVLSGGALAPLGNALIGVGIGSVITGVGQLITGDPIKGFATAQRNPIAPWRVALGRVRTGGSVVYMHTWGANDKVLDLVIVLADHACAGIDEVLFDQQRLQIDTNAIPTSALAGYSIPAPASGAGTSFTPVQQKIAITSTISRSNDVVTVIIPTDIPYLSEGDPIGIADRNGESILAGAGLIGTFQVLQIISRVPSGGTNILTFTYLCGGLPVTITNHGEVQTRWVDYGRTVYFEPLLGNQQLGQTFIGMTAGVPWQGTGKLNTPAAQPNAQGSTADGTAGPNPWTNYCSLQGKTAVFLRIQFDPKYYPSGLPQISFHLRGKNDIYDPRLGACTGVKKAGLSAAGAGYTPSSLYTAGDVLTLVQGGASGGQITVTSVNGSGAIVSWLVTAPGTGYALGAVTTTGGHGTGATFVIQALTGATGSNGYTENPALCIADFLADRTWGYKAAYGTDIPSAALIASANVCDTPVTLAAGGTEPMYALNGQFDLTMKRGEILQNMLTSCAGRMSPEAPFAIQPGYWVSAGSPPLTLDLQSIAAGPYVWRGPAIREQYNGVKGTYISPANKWQSTDYPYYAQDAMHGYSGPAQYGGDINLAADGGERRWLELHLPFTISSSMAQRIGKIELLRRRFANSGSGTFACNMAAYQLAPLDVFLGTAAFLGISGQDLEVVAARLKAEVRSGLVLLSTEIDVQNTDSSIYAWSTSEELTSQGYVQSHPPSGTFSETAPLPWSPGYPLTYGSPLAQHSMPLAGDAIGGPASFGIQTVYGQDAQGNATAALEIKGTPPINALDTGVASPQITCVASSSGGSLPPGDYIVGLSAYDSGAASHANTDYQTVAVVTVLGSGSGSIAVTVTWGSGDDGGDLYVGKWNSAGYVFHYNQTLTPGQASATITALDQTQAGGPDFLFDHFGVVWQEEIHGGCWAQQIEAVTATTITFSGAGMTLNQWAGYALSVLAKVDFTQEIPLLNIPIASSTASSGGLFTITIGPGADGNTLPNLTTLLAVGDLLVCRTNPTFTASSFTDPNIANGFYPSGATGVEAGHVAVVLTGPDAGDVQTILSVSLDGFGNATIFNLAGNWKVTPNSGDIVIICAPGNAPEVPGSPSRSRNKSVSGVMATVDVKNLTGQTWLFRVRTEDSAGNFGSDSVAPFREVYFFGAQGTRVITSATAGGMLLTDRVLKFDTSGVSGSTTTLNGNINSSVTSITLNAAYSAPNGTVLQIGSELMYVQSGSGSTGLTVVRNWAGSTAASHSNGDTVSIPGALVWNLIAFTSVPNQNFLFSKISSDINYVKLVPQGSDQLPDNETFHVLADTSATYGTFGMTVPAQ